jgi:hypothetical protein
MYPPFHVRGVPSKVGSYNKTKKEEKKKIRLTNNNVVQYDPCTSPAMPAIGYHFPAECIIHDSTDYLVRDSNDCVVSQEYNQSQDDNYVNFTFNEWNKVYEQGHHLDENTRVVHIPTDFLELCSYGGL